MWYSCNLIDKVSRIEVGYWRVEDPTLFDSSTFPTFLYADGEGHFRYYGLPIEEYPGLLKVFFLLYILLLKNLISFIVCIGMCSFWTKCWPRQSRCCWRSCNLINDFKVYKWNFQRSTEKAEYHRILYVHSKSSKYKFSSCYSPLWAKVSPDDAPVIDKHPQHDNIIIAAGFSGMAIHR